MQRATALARGIDKAMLIALLYIAAFIWMYTRVRSLLWGALLAAPLTLLIVISVHMLRKHLPALKDKRLEAEHKEHALFLLLTGDTRETLTSIANSIYETYGYHMGRVEEGVAFSEDEEGVLAIGVLHGAADTGALLAFHKAAGHARRALLCSLEAPAPGAAALAHRLTAPTVTVFGPSDVMRFIKGVAPSEEEREHTARARRAQGIWAAFRGAAVRRERAVRYMLYALALTAIYILTGWVWYPVPALLCAALGAASACRAKTPESPFG